MITKLQLKKLRTNLKFLLKNRYIYKIIFEKRLKNTIEYIDELLK